MNNDDQEITELREKWDKMSHNEKVDKFLWKMVWYHHTKHIPGSPAQPIWDLTKVIDTATKSADKNSRAMTYLTGALVFLGVVQIIVAIW